MHNFSHREEPRNEARINIAIMTVYQELHVHVWLSDLSISSQHICIIPGKHTCVQYLIVKTWLREDMREDMTMNYPARHQPAGCFDHCILAKLNTSLCYMYMVYKFCQSRTCCCSATSIMLPSLFLCLHATEYGASSQDLEGDWSQYYHRYWLLCRCICSS